MPVKVFVISLPRSSDRRRSIVSQLDSFGVDYEITDAIDGSRLNESELSRLVEPTARSQSPQWLNPSAIACAASHLFCYQKIVDRDLQHALILEDDMVFNVNLSLLLSWLTSLPLDPLSVTLLYYRSDPSRVFNFIQTKYRSSALGLSLASPSTCLDIPICAGAYFVSNEAAASLLHDNSPVSKTADCWATYIANAAIKRVYVVWPRVCVGARFDSTINYAQSYYNPLLFSARRLLSRLPISLFKKYRRSLLERRMSRFRLHPSPDLP